MSRSSYDNKVIVDRLFSLKDDSYKSLSERTIPSIGPDSIIGVRTPVLKALAKELNGTELAAGFINDLPHKYFEENQLHAFLISLDKDYGRCIDNINRFLPYVDNWATCDQLIPKVFAKHHAELSEQAIMWIDDGRTYTVRYGIKVLMNHFLGDDYDIRYLEKACSVKTDEYYIQMVIAWFFAEALVKQYDDAVVFMEQHRLDPVIHKMTVRKACDSFRVPDEVKKYLRNL